MCSKVLGFDTNLVISKLSFVCFLQNLTECRQDETADGPEREHVQGHDRGARQGARQQPDLQPGERRGEAQGQALVSPRQGHP